MTKMEIVGPIRVGVEDEDAVKGYRLVKGYAIAHWDEKQSQWTVNSIGGGFGFGRSPEAAAKGAAFDNGVAPSGYRTKREAKEAIREEVEWETR